MFDSAFLIAQGWGSASAARDDLESTESELRANDVKCRGLIAASRDEALNAAVDALEQGERLLVAVAGDGVVNAVSDGMLRWSGGASSDAALGVVAGSSPSDFIRTFGLPSEPALACRHLLGEEVFPIDAVRVTGEAFGDGIGHLVNVAEVGLGGVVAKWIERLPDGLGRVRRFMGFWLATASFRPADLQLRGDRRTWEGRAHNVIVGNGQYAGGYRISPRSWPSDGYIDVLVMKGPKSDSFTILNKAVLGEHLPHPNIVEYRSRTLSVESSRPIPVIIDGSVLGSTPMSFEVLPQAIRLKI